MDQDKNLQKLLKSVDKIHDPVHLNQNILSSIKSNLIEEKTIYSAKKKAFFGALATLIMIVLVFISFSFQESSIQFSVPFISLMFLTLSFFIILILLELGIVNLFKNFNRYTKL